MRVTVRFLDGERLDGNAEQVSLDNGGFTLVGTGGNTRSIWVGAGAIKYVAIHPATSETYERDPRDGDRLPKLVLHFLDGETVRTYQDQAYGRQPGGFTMRLWDDDEKQLVKALVSAASLKGVFTVDEWDSRTEEEKRRHNAATEVTASDHDEWVEQEPLFEAPELDAPATPDDEVPPGIPHVDEEQPLAPLMVEEPVFAEVGIEETAAVVQEAVRAAVEEAVHDAVEEAVHEAVEEAVHEAVPAAVEEAVLATMPEAAIVAAQVVADDAEPGEPPRRDLPAVIRGDAEERRATFGSGLGRRSKLAQALTPEEERHRQLRARISQVLGSITVVAPEDTDDGDAAAPPA
jgi:hypothetical protein